MGESEIQVSPFPTVSKPERAFLVGIAGQNDGMSAAKEYLEELHELVDTLGIPVCGEVVAPIRQIHPKFYVGSGKLEEIRDMASGAGADMLIFDCELGPSQQRCGQSGHRERRGARTDARSRLLQAEKEPDPGHFSRLQQSGGRGGYHRY